MPGTVDGFTVEHGDGRAVDFRALDQDFVSTGSSDPLRVSGDVAIQLSGTATSFTAVVERSTRDPATNSNWAPCGPALSGDLTAGFEVQLYTEPTRAWWRLRVTAIAGGTLKLNISGLKA